MATTLHVAAFFQREEWEGRFSYAKSRLHYNVGRPSPHRNGPFQEIVPYNDLNEIIQGIQQFQQNDPDHPCLLILEIIAHGDPTSLNGFTRTDINTIAAAFMQLVWCDNAKIFLSGCNTGLPMDTSSNPTAVIGPFAKMLADAMPYNATSFAYKIDVHGSAGYLSGSYSQGSTDTSTDLIDRWLWKKTYYGPYPGCRVASGSQVWNVFKNY